MSNLPTRDEVGVSELKGEVLRAHPLGLDGLPGSSGGFHNSLVLGKIKKPYGSISPCRYLPTEPSRDLRLANPYRICNLAL